MPTLVPMSQTLRKRWGANNLLKEFSFQENMQGTEESRRAEGKHWSEGMVSDSLKCSDSLGPLGQLCLPDGPGLALGILGVVPQWLCMPLS